MRKIVMNRTSPTISQGQNSSLYCHYCWKSQSKEAGCRALFLFFATDAEIFASVSFLGKWSHLAKGISEFWLSLYFLKTPGFSCLEIFQKKTENCLFLLSTCITIKHLCSSSSACRYETVPWKYKSTHWIPHTVCRIHLIFVCIDSVVS